MEVLNGASAAHWARELHLGYSHCRLRLCWEDEQARLLTGDSGCAHLVRGRQADVASDTQDELPSRLLNRKS